MRHVATIASILVFVLLAIDVFGATPTVDQVDYNNPNQYLAFPDSLGNRAAILAQASKLKGASGLDTIHNVLVWMDQTLKYDENKPDQWATYDDVMRDKTYGGCAEQGIVCGVLLKGAGIPVVWVKTMDVAWIWDFKKGRPFTSWSGHVFLEVFANGKWSLLDPGGKTLYQDYSPKMRILPGQRFAYDKGNDPKAMIMSSQWEPWKQQTAAYFRQLDEALLPVDEKGGTSLVRQAYVIGNSPYYEALTAMAVESGLQVAQSFNCEYERFLPQAKGHVILIETHKGKPIVPKTVLEQYYPNAFSGISRPSKSIWIKDTLIVFVDFSEQLQAVGNVELSKEKEPANKTGTGDSKSSRAYASAPFLLSLEDVPVGNLPEGWTATKTGEGPGSVWKVVEDATAPNGKKALAQTSDKGPNGLFNLCVGERSSFRDIDLTVAFKAVAGKLDQGGGPVWRYQDAKNYYLARMNPLEDNYRVYKVVDGNRIQLGNADVKLAAGQWHMLRVVQEADHIQCYLDGKLYLDVKDDTFKDAGKIGLWTKADAQTSFADLSVKASR